MQHVTLAFMPGTCLNGGMQMSTTEGAKMSRKDYRLIAGVLADQLDSCVGQEEFVSAQAIFRVAEALADELARDNPRFKRATFMAAVSLGFGKDQ